MKICLVGTRGVPARYGGFETAVEEVGARLASRGHEVVVYCRGATQTRAEYLGMHLVHLPAIRLKVLETMSHTTLSCMHPSIRDADVAIVFNAANAPLVKVIQALGTPVCVHVDGLEWKRSKWGPVGRRYYLACERLAVRWADALIADAVGIQTYYREKYRTEARFIPYGAPRTSEYQLSELDKYGLEPRRYHLVVARLEPENNVHMALEAAGASGVTLPMVIVGGAPYGREYSKRLAQLGRAASDVRMLGPVWDQTTLDALYAGSLTYVHGHSVGGTNPSLLRAMGAGAPVLAYDVQFNREVLGPTGCYWASAPDLGKGLIEAEGDPDRARERGTEGRARAHRLYEWDDVADRYEAMCAEVARLCDGPR